jgi:hypothetical protein
MNWAKVIKALEKIALDEAKKAQANLEQCGGTYNRGEELRAVANRQKIGANILLQLSQALAKGLK